MMGEEELTRRKFISASGVIVSSLLAGGNLMTYCGSTKSPTEKTSSDSGINDKQKRQAVDSISTKCPRSTPESKKMGSGKLP